MRALLSPPGVVLAVVDHRVVAMLGAVCCLVGLVVWTVAVARVRLIQDLPTSRARGVALGLNELTGRATVDPEVISPQTGHRCVWWKNVFYEETDDRKWRKVAERQSPRAAFRLVDASGSIEVRPRHAEVTGVETHDGSPLVDRHGPDPGATLVSRYVARRDGKRARVVETVIPLDAEVYVLGTARLPAESLDVYVGADPGGQHPFVVRAGAEADVVFDQRVGAVAGALLAIVGAVVGAIAWFDGPGLAEGTTPWRAVDPVPPIIFAFTVGGVMSMAALVMSYNGLMRLRERVMAAWGLIDVQLHRRHDLIPRLVAAAQAHAGHERRVQEAVAALRANPIATVGANPSDREVGRADPEIRQEGSAVTRLVGLLEALPTLRADASFARLRDELVDTEDRIALARSFYNRSVRALHDRARAQPGRTVAWMFELDLQAAFTDELDGAGSDATIATAVEAAMHSP